MATRTQDPAANAGHRRTGIGAPPLPHEHGAWAMLYVPLALGLALSPAAPLPALLLFVAATAAFLAREPADLLLRGRGRDGSAFWLMVFLLVLAASGGTLALGLGYRSLLPVAGAAAILFAGHAALLTWPNARRADRSAPGEVLAVAGLTLTAPAARALGAGRLDAEALWLWLACAAFFASSVFFVKMLLGGVKHKGAMDGSARARIGRWNLAYHAAMLAGMVWLASGGAVLLAVAYAPVAARAIWWNARLSRRLPNLKRIGFLELAYALWFLAFSIAGFGALGKG